MSSPEKSLDERAEAIADFVETFIQVSPTLFLSFFSGLVFVPKELARVTVIVENKIVRLRNITKAIDASHLLLMNAPEEEIQSFLGSQLLEFQTVLEKSSTILTHRIQKSTRT